MANTLKTVREALRIAGLLVLVLAILFIVWWVNGFVSNRNIQDAVVTESSAVRAQLDARADGLAAKVDALGARLEAADRKLDRIEGKLDRLIEFTLRPLGDGLQRVE